MKKVIPAFEEGECEKIGDYLTEQKKWGIIKYCYIIGRYRHGKDCGNRITEF